MTDSQLKPCPFCGQTDYVYFTPATDDAEDGRYGFVTPPVIGCKKCGFEKTGAVIDVRRRDGTVEHLSDKYLIKWWNKRA